MSATLERRYRRLVRGYPPAWRRERGEELIGTLMDLSRPGQNWPAPREARALLLGGIRVRAGVDRLDSTAQVWLDGARAALVLMLAWQIVMQVWLLELARGDRPAGEPVSWTVTGGAVVTVVVAGAAAVAVLSGRYRLGFALALLTPLPALFPPFGHTWDNLYVFEVACWWLPVIGLSVPLLRRPGVAGPWRWMLAVPLLFLASTLLPLLGLGLASLFAVLGMLAVCLVWGAVVDPRPTIALGLLLLTVIPQLVASAAVLVIVVPVFLVLGAALLTTGALRARHRAAA